LRFALRFLNPHSLLCPVGKSFQKFAEKSQGSLVGLPLADKSAGDASFCQLILSIKFFFDFYFCPPLKHHLKLSIQKSFSNC